MFMGSFISRLLTDVFVDIPVTDTGKLLIFILWINYDIWKNFPIY